MLLGARLLTAFRGAEPLLGILFRTGQFQPVGRSATAAEASNIAAVL
jgi:hypothetical protein